MTGSTHITDDIDPCHGTVPGSIFNQLQREWMIQKHRADALQAQIDERDRRSYLPQLSKAREQRDNLAAVLRTVTVPAEEKEAIRIAIQNNT